MRYEVGFAMRHLFQVWISCDIVDPVTGSVYCSGSGLYLKNRERGDGGGKT